MNRIALFLSRCIDTLRDGIDGPFPIEEYLKQNGVEMVRIGNADELKAEARLLFDREPQHFQIVLGEGNATSVSAKRRTRFSLAHELGHILLIRGLNYNPISAGPEFNRCEKLIDRFAAELLCPSKIVKRYVDVGDRVQATLGIIRLTYEFDVSLRVAVRQAIEVSHHWVFGIAACERKHGDRIELFGPWNSESEKNRMKRQFKTLVRSSIPGWHRSSFRTLRSTEVNGLGPITYVRTERNYFFCFRKWPLTGPDFEGKPALSCAKTRLVEIRNQPTP